MAFVIFKTISLLNLCLTLQNSQTQALEWSADQVEWNLNQNENATGPLEYWGEWENHPKTPSPSNWRMPFYMLTLDRFVDGQPSNNDANGTVFENDWTTNQFRFGGDAKGLMDNLDWIQDLGIKAIYFSGSPFINMPWASDGFGPLDFTLLDAHHGTIDEWRQLIQELHTRGMYAIMENTIGTMGDLLAFESWENETTPFNAHEYDALWKSSRRYHDFEISNDVLQDCEYPVFYGDDGFPVNASIMATFDNQCRKSDFDQYGDMKGVGYVPPYQSQLSKFASVQDRLRLWKHDVLEKVKHFSCMQIAMLDIDGFRVDKALQTPADALAEWATYQRECARQYGKDNFLVTGEVVGELKYSSVFFGRGKSPNIYFDNQTEAQLATNATEGYIRESGNNALDGSNFHYPTYGALTRFLGLDGDIGFEGVDFAQHWNAYLLTDDFVNVNTGLFDPRHMFGTTNQDVFRWAALVNGTQRQVLGFFITFLEMPGIPELIWGDEVEFKVLENLAADYMFGRQPMASTRAWQMHGCYKVGAAGNGYYDMPFGDALLACEDDSVSLDQRNPAHSLRNLIKRMFQLRTHYPILNDGFTLQTLFFETRDVFLPHSGQLPTPLGIWSVYRGRTPGVQDFTGEGMGNQGIWLLYSNQNETVHYSYDCSNSSGSLVAPFPEGTTIKNLFYPYQEYTLNSSTTKLGIEGSDEINGCLPGIELEAWGFRAFVPIDKFVAATPVISGAIPRHDARIETTADFNDVIAVPVTLSFTQAMDCSSILKSISFESTTQTGIVPHFEASSIVCRNITVDNSQRFVGEALSTFQWSANLVNLSHGVHTYTVANASSADGISFTNTKDKFMLRVGRKDNPVVFPRSANYTTGLVHRDATTGELRVTPKAAGSTQWRFSTNYGSSWSDWTSYTGETTTIEEQAWSGTSAQQWSGVHIVTQYYSPLIGSTDHVQHSDLDAEVPRRWPKVHVQGPWNQYGYDAGLDDQMNQDFEGIWNFDLSSEWPTSVILNVWGMNLDGAPDKSAAYGDVDGDNVLDWVPPDSLSFNQLNITPPSWPHTAYKIAVNDGSMRYTITPTGSANRQLALYILLAILPLITACLAVAIYHGSFYRLKYNSIGLTKRSYPFNQFQKKRSVSDILPLSFTKISEKQDATDAPEASDGAVVTTEASRTILIATMEYAIADEWKISIKIGGLGVMAGLMAKHLTHHNLIWVVPCVGDVVYPIDRVMEPIKITVMGKPYLIDCQIHVVGRITYVLLDAPLFRQQTKKEPYPARMDDLDSAIYYSAWNACIAEVMRRHPEIDIYHINDYHGAVAPLHLLPRVIPVCLSLHNAEFQGLWSINTPKKMQEMSDVFNLDKSIIRRYVQWGDNFNLLHAGASYLRIHQKGFGAVGVSKKYGARSFARYPIFWGLPKVGILPNPDPADIEHFDKCLPNPDVAIDREYEASRGATRKQAQQWANLNIDESAELFVFVGRWSMQKGIDLIADVFPKVLEENPKAQLICVGPVIDLYGKFAALKLDYLMKKYPGRVYSKPMFVYVPPFVHAGAEFALIPSRDEPFGLVSVEFGRKGALGVGAKVGGLGQMPGWWFQIESSMTRHMLSQFKKCIQAALSSDQETRALMRARSKEQRFPVAQWVEDLEILQTKAIKINTKVQDGSVSALSTPNSTPNNSPPRSRAQSRVASPAASRSCSPTPETPAPQFRRRLSSLLYPAHPTAEQYLPFRRRLSSLFPMSRRSPFQHSEAGADIAELEESRDEVGSLPPSSPTFRPGTAGSMSAAHALFTPGFGFAEEQNLPGELTRPTLAHYRRSSTLSVDEVVGEKTDYSLQKVDQSFTDSQLDYYRIYETMLGSLTAKNSEGKLCIETFLHSAEKNWYRRFGEAKLGRTVVSPPEVGSKKFGAKGVSVTVREASSISESERTASVGAMSHTSAEQFFTTANYKAPTGISKLMMSKIPYLAPDWPFYAYLMAFGQIVAVNSHQITIITGAQGENANKLYTIASIYLAGSLFWWLMIRRLASKWALSLPFVLYGLAFFFVGLAPFGTTLDSRGWIQNVGAGLYSFASASGSLYFALNFASEGGVPIQTMIFRATAVQGVQQLWVAALWAWGSAMSANHTSQFTNTIMNSKVLLAIMAPIALLFVSVGVILLLGLPEYYHNSPGKAPSFYTSVWKRKIVLWFFVAIIAQNYWLSAPTGRNWQYLFSSTQAPVWSIVLLLLLFFIVIWCVALYTLSRFSEHHSWFLPIFGAGLGAPRWCQMLWSTSGMGLYLPWGSTVGSAIAGRSLWLWLGTLDALSGVGIGTMLLQTLTRHHVAVTLTAAQVLGSIATIAARASSPDATGPGAVFPNLAVSLAGLGAWEFWVALLFQLVLPIGFLMFFRNEQLFKP
ncbi:alpha-1,3-glucan synthase [Aureobasidium pullulans]|uniref:alpha-1,3-glucan synthase n=1 Tax=Aureobasidium pullulans TaxID=5580 RepID=A0A4S9XNH2_AURPU|nr:alpha-1,3-glucan synthase [Aureobasidium pullulans]